MISKSCDRAYHGACKDITGCDCSCHTVDREKMNKKYGK